MECWHQLRWTFRGDIGKWNHLQLWIEISPSEKQGFFSKTGIYVPAQICSLISLWKTTKSNLRQKREPALAIAALVSVGLFGGEILLGKTADCGLRRTFGSCNDKSKENAENIDRLSELARQIAENVFTLAENLDEKYFMVTSEFYSIKQAQDEILQNQNWNWEIIQEHFEVFKQNYHILRDCDHFSFTRQQINFNHDTVSSLLAITFANVKSYGSALYFIASTCLTRYVFAE